MESDNQPLKVFVIGEVGQGKSTIINAILNENVTKVGDADEDEYLTGVTKNIQKFTGKVSGGQSIEIFDSPGFGDIDKNPNDMVKEYEEKLGGICIDCVLIVLRIDNHRLNAFTAMSLEIFKILTKSEDPWDNLILFFTHCDKVKPDRIKIIGEKTLQKLNEILKGTISKKVYFRNDQPEEGIVMIFDYFSDRELLKKNIQFKEKIDVKRAQSLIEKFMGKFKCFDSESIVYVKEIESNSENFKVIEKKIKNVKIGDLIQVSKNNFQIAMTKTVSDDNQLIYSFYAVLENHIDKENDITSQKCKEVLLKLTQQHYMFIKRNSEEFLHLPARKIIIGDKLIDLEGLTYIIKEINLEYCQSVTNIRTPSLKMIVNNLQCSCIAEDDAGYIGHLVLIALNQINSSLPQKLNQLALKFKI